jgi:hypothetical protein
MTRRAAHGSNVAEGPTDSLPAHAERVFGGNVMHALDDGIRLEEQDAAGWGDGGAVVTRSDNAMR